MKYSILYSGSFVDNDGSVKFFANERPLSVEEFNALSKTDEFSYLPEDCWGDEAIVFDTVKIKTCIEEMTVTLCVSMSPRQYEQMKEDFKEDIVKS